MIRLVRQNMFDPPPVRTGFHLLGLSKPFNVCVEGLIQKYNHVIFIDFLVAQLHIVTHFLALIGWSSIQLCPDSFPCGNPNRAERLLMSHFRSIVRVSLY